MAYAKRDENAPVISSPSFTLIGESTPEVLYENVNETLISNGLLPRFSVIEYGGPRVSPSKTHDRAVPSDALVQWIAALCAQCISISSAGKVQNVAINNDARAIFDRFNEYCDDKINSHDSGVIAELWNRAHLKALKRASSVCLNSFPVSISGAPAGFRLPREEAAD